MFCGSWGFNCSKKGGPPLISLYIFVSTLCYWNPAIIKGDSITYMGSYGTKCVQEARISTSSVTMPGETIYRVAGPREVIIESKPLMIDMEDIANRVEALEEFMNDARSREKRSNKYKVYPSTKSWKLNSGGLSYGCTVMHSNPGECDYGR